MLEVTGFLYKLEQEVVRDILSQANFEILANFGIWHQKPHIDSLSKAINVGRRHDESL